MEFLKIKCMPPTDDKLICPELKFHIKERTQVIMYRDRVKILDLSDFPLISGALVIPLLHHLQPKSLPGAVPQVWFLAKGTEKEFPAITVRKREDNLLFKTEKKFKIVNQTP